MNACGWLPRARCWLPQPVPGCCLWASGCLPMGARRLLTVGGCGLRLLPHRRASCAGTMRHTAPVVAPPRQGRPETPPSTPRSHRHYTAPSMHRPSAKRAVLRDSAAGRVFPTGSIGPTVTALPLLSAHCPCPASQHGTTHGASGAVSHRQASPTGAHRRALGPHQ